MVRFRLFSQVPAPGKPASVWTNLRKNQGNAGRLPRRRHLRKQANRTFSPAANFVDELLRAGVVITVRQSASDSR